MTVIIDSRTDRPGTITADAFKSVFRRHPAGVGVITLAQEGRLVGFTATSVISVSAEPPLLAFSIDSRSSSWPSLALTDSVAISFLAAEQVDVSARFATSG
ncbi:MAG: flavin reductase family protein, partial [Propionibacteriaceae bacterium]